MNDVRIEREAPRPGMVRQRQQRQGGGAPAQAQLPAQREHAGGESHRRDPERRRHAGERVVAKHEREPGVEGVCTQLADRWGMQRSPLQHRRRDAAGVRELEPVAPVPPAAGGGVDRDAEPRDRDGGHGQQPEHDHGPAGPGLAAQAPQQIAGRRSPQRPGQQRAAHRRQQQCQRPGPQQVHERQHRRRPQHHRVSEAEHPRQRGPGSMPCRPGAPPSWRSHRTRE